MLFSIQLAAATLLAVGVQAHNTLPAPFHHRLLARQSSNSYGFADLDECTASLEALCTGENITTACTDAYCAPACLSRNSDIVGCCSGRTADVARTLTCIDNVYAAEWPLEPGQDPNQPIPSTRVRSPLPTDFTYYASSTALMSATATGTAAAGHVSSSSSGVVSSSPSSSAGVTGAAGKTTGASLTSPAATTTGTHTTGASVTANPTGNAAGAMTVARVGGFGLGIAWLLNLLIF